MDLGLEEIVGGVTPPDLSERIEQAARACVVEKAAPRPRRLGALILIAASLLVGALVLWKILASTPAPVPAPAKEQRQEPPPSKDPDTLQRMADTLEEEAGQGDADPERRGEAFLRFNGSFEDVSRALFKAAVCFRVDGNTKWAKLPGNQDARVALTRAEQTFVKVLARQSDPVRCPLMLLTWFELATLSMHEANPNPASALELLNQVAKAVPEGDRWVGRVWVAQIRCNLDLKRLDPAVQILDRLLERYPGSAGVAWASKSVAIKLDEATSELMRTNGDPATIEQNLRKVCRYYVTWINIGPVQGLRISPADLLSASETLYMAARRLNHLGNDIWTAHELREKIVDPGLFADAAYVSGLLIDVPALPLRDRLAVGGRQGRCLGFVAQDPKGWKAAADAYDKALKPLNLVTAQGWLDGAVLVAHREALSLYMEQGYALAKVKTSIDAASTIFSNVLRVVQNESEPWWFSKYMVLECLYNRGTESDLKLAAVGLENLERSMPTFDNGRFGMKSQFLKLKKQIDEARQK